MWQTLHTDKTQSAGKWRVVRAYDRYKSYTPHSPFSSQSQALFQGESFALSAPAFLVLSEAGLGDSARAHGSLSAAWEAKAGSSRFALQLSLIVQPDASNRLFVGRPFRN